MTINTLVMPSSVSTIHQTLYKHLRCVCQNCVKWICRDHYEFNQRNCIDVCVEICQKKSNMFEKN